MRKRRAHKRVLAMVAAAVVGVILTPPPAPAQLIVGPVTRPPRPGLIFCQAHHRGHTYYTAQVWGDRNYPERSPLKAAFSDYMRSQIGDLSPEVSCYGDNYSGEPPGGLPQTTWTGFTGGLPTEGPPQAQRAPTAPARPVAEASAASEPAVAPKADEQAGDVQALNQSILDRHAATEAEARRREAAHAEAMRQHQARVDAADAAQRAHQQELARAQAARQAYERELAAHEALVRGNRTQQDREALVDWREAVTVCRFESDNPQSRFGNWTCHGPLQYTYAKLGDTGTAVTAGALAEVALACGVRRESVRDLGMVDGQHLFGCGFGLHPEARNPLYRDQAARFGISYVPDRAVYRCPRYHNSCRVR